MKKKLKIGKNLAILAVFLLTSFTYFGCASKDENHVYINDSASFIRALQNGEKNIYVGDISFENQTEIKLNYPVSIIGKDDKSVIENAHIILNATNVPEETMDITIKNVIFDGLVSKNDISLEEGKTFTEIVNEMTMYSCIDGSIGYYTLNIDNCEIRNYINESGPALYINNNTNYRLGKKALNLTNTKIYNNISNSGTVKVFSDVLTTNVDNCEFYDNLARAGQGIAVGDGKSVITNTIIHDNDFFRFLNPMERKLPNIFHDDKQTFKGVTTSALGSCCGVLFIGGSNTIVDNCQIYNNKTIYGGGIGIINSATLNENEKIEINNTIIKNNEAILSGAAIYLESNQGETTYFNNCEITGNTAGENGSVIYTTTYMPDDASSYGGNVLFTFCTIANNSATDANTFNFYDLLMPELSGSVHLKGCFVIDNCNYISSDNEYNYIASKQKAIEDDVISEADIAKISEKGITPKKNSVGEIIVPVSEYIKWSDVYSNASKDRCIGSTSLSADNTFSYMFVIIAALIILAIVILFIFLKKKVIVNEASEPPLNVEVETSGERKEIDYEEYDFNDVLAKIEKQYSGILTKKEIEVATYLLYGHRRKEIASKLVVSDETIKSHVSNIFKKTGVSSKGEFKKITEEKIFVKEK